jgi:hypothetical protein
MRTRIASCGLFLLVSGCEGPCTEPLHGLRVAGVPMDCVTGSTTVAGNRCPSKEVEVSCARTSPCDVAGTTGPCFPVRVTFEPECGSGTVQAYSGGALVFDREIRSGTELRFPLSRLYEFKLWAGHEYTGGWATFACENDSSVAGAGN